MSVLLLLLACTAPPPPDPEPPAAPPTVEVAPEPELMADLAIPSSPDLVLGPSRPAPRTARAFFPEHRVGDWQLYRVWRSERDRDWEPAEVQIFWDRVGPPEVERDQLRAVGEAMEPFASTKLAVVGPTWAVKAARQTGQASLRPLSPPELLISPTTTTFKSAWIGQMVTVEVLGVQQITVPAGAFEALHVRRQWALGTRRTSEDAWWTAARGMVARALRVQSADTPEARLTVLSEYGSVEDPDTLRQVWSDGRAAMGLPE